VFAHAHLTKFRHLTYLGHMTEASQPAAVPPVWTLGDRLRKARETAGLNQSELADEIGIGRTSVVNYESGRKMPSRPVLLSWALRTSVPYEWLSGEPAFRRVTFSSRPNSTAPPRTRAPLGLAA
jgi:DNA-binding XRE family transcriptional regulator